MKFFEKVESYFNSGSTDKQNKRRLGGLLIAITAILLVLATVILAVGGAIWGIVSLFDKPDDGGDETPTTNTHLSVVDISEVIEEAKNGIPLDNTVVTTLSLVYENSARAKTTANENIYTSSGASQYKMQADAYNAFNAMMLAFYNEKGLTGTYINGAYVDENSSAIYNNGLTVKLDHVDDNGKNLGSIYNVGDNKNSKGNDVTAYQWIYENAYKYGFVQLSAASGEENLFRYVGLAHAKKIYDAQKKNDETFYTIEAYVAEIKLSTPDNTIKLSGIKSLEDDKKWTYYTYYMPSDSAEFKLPNNKYTYTVTSTADGGYIVTYCKTVR